jgi:DNA-binding transcriptional regulator YhcF (GntR family)
VLSLTAAPLYDCPEGIDVMEGGQVSAARPGYRQVAATLREKILSGEIPAGSVLSSNPVLAAELGDPDRPLSTATVNAAVSELARDGLVRVEHGRPTMVLEQCRYRVELMVDAQIALADPDGVYSAFDAAVRAAVGADPASDALSVDRLGHGRDLMAVKIVALVTAAHSGLAAYRLTELVRAASSSSSYYWNVARSVVSASPE